MTFVGAIYESVIIIIAAIILALIFLKYQEKKHRLTLLLFIIFMCFGATIVCTWLSKLISLFANLDYVNNADTPDPLTIDSILVLRMVNYRFAFVFIALASAFSFILKVKMFKEGYNQTEKWFMIVFGCFTIFFQMVFYAKDNMIFDLIAFALVAFYMAIIYLPFMKLCLEGYKSVDDPIYKKGFLSLAIMSLSVSLILVCQLIDKVIYIITETGYSPFYFLGLIFALVGYFGAYFGYIRPKSK